MLNISKLAIDLVINGDLFELPYFNSQEDLEEYLGEKTSINYNNEDEILNFIYKWEKDHKLAIIKEEIASYDLEKMYVAKISIFTLDGKYYRLCYRELFSYGSVLAGEPREVYPIEETIKVTKYVTNKPNDKASNEVQK